MFAESTYAMPSLCGESAGTSLNAYAVAGATTAAVITMGSARRNQRRAMVFAFRPAQLPAALERKLPIGIVASGLGPPVVRCRLPIRIRDDAVDRAHRRKAFLATGTQLRDDDHVDAVVEDRTELRRTMPDARVAIDANGHVDLEGRVLPLRIAFVTLQALGPVPCRHRHRSYGAMPQPH